MTKKDLFIINGITGAIGSAFLSLLAKRDNTIIYGLSRRAAHFRVFIHNNNNKLFAKTLICSLPELDKNTIEDFTGLIDYSQFRSVTYIHALGLYPFEIDQDGNHVVENDNDQDGINDMTLDLSYRLFKDMVSAIRSATEHNGLKGCAVIFGGLADKHRPIAHTSWWKTIEMTKQYFSDQNNDRFGIHVLNISSVICPHEIITRPFVFIKTDANGKYWLTPDEVAERGLKCIAKNPYRGFHEYEIFNKRPRFDLMYYQNEKFTPRKVAELY